jgi:hypothetical protein
VRCQLAIAVGGFARRALAGPSAVGAGAILDRIPPF